MSSLNVALNHLDEPYRSEVVEEIERLRSRVAELEKHTMGPACEISKAEARVLGRYSQHVLKSMEYDRDRYKRAAEALARVLGAYSKNLSDGFTMDRVNTTLRTAEAWLRWAMESPPEQQAQKENVCEFCGDPNCTFQNPLCVQHQERISRAMAHGMPRSGRHG